MDDKKNIIVGAGLVGSLLGLTLLRKGNRITIYEARSDMRMSTKASGRSINLALSHRGIKALEMLGIKEQVLQFGIKMKSRIIHALNGDILVQDYGTREGEYINSISRKTLNEILMNELQKIQDDAIVFDTKLESVDSHQNEFVFSSKNGNRIVEKNCRVFGTDGSASITRDYFLNQSGHLRFNFSQTYQNYGYKELTLPASPSGDFQISSEGLHIWPRGHFMMIALPNPDGSFTCTLFAPFYGLEGFDSLRSKEEVENYFTKYFPDIFTKFDDLAEQFFENPIGNLVTVKCSPWHHNDSVLLLGDAAHAIIPFYGQGMNCGFEDVYELNRLIDEKKNWGEIFAAFTDCRKSNSDAIADLAEDNFVEMRDKVGDPLFQKKRAFEVELEKRFSNYYSKYSLVTFRPDLPYSTAMKRGRRQDEILMNFCATFAMPDLDHAYSLLQEEGLFG